MTVTFDIDTVAAQLRALERAAVCGSVAVVVPLAEGRVDVVREFVAEGPPFDPRAVGLTRHEVFLTEQEAVFVFDAQECARAFERIMAEPELWDVVTAWEHCMAGPPRFGVHVFSWAES